MLKNRGSAEKYEALFDGESTPLDRLSNRGVKLQRVKTIKAGPMLEVECFPIWCTKAAQDAKRAMESPKTREAQKRINYRNSVKALYRKANANFGKDDLIVTNTYAPGTDPIDDEAAQRDAQNYIKRLRRLRARLGMGELKYLYVIERTEGPEYGRRYHMHLITNGGGLDRDAVEAVWGKGNSNSRRYQWQENHLTGFACYMTKNKDTQAKVLRRKWVGSKNLVEPAVTVADKKISRRKVERIAENIQEVAPQVFCALYPAYDFVECTVRKSSYVPGAYIYVRMRAQEGARPRREAVS